MDSKSCSSSFNSLGSPPSYREIIEKDNALFMEKHHNYKDLIDQFLVKRSQSTNQSEFLDKKQNRATIKSNVKLKSVTSVTTDECYTNPNIGNHKNIVRPRSSSAFNRTNTASLIKNNTSIQNGKQPFKKLTTEIDTHSESRRDRLLLLRKQAEDRIIAKKFEDEKLKREKARKEEEEAELIRQEYRKRVLDKKEVTSRQNDENNLLKLNLIKAKQFRSYQLLIRFGISPWKEYLDYMRNLARISKRFRAEKLITCVFNAWSGYVIMVKLAKARLEVKKLSVSNSFYRRKLLQRIMISWKMISIILKKKEKSVARHFTRYTQLKKSFHAWGILLERMRRIEIQKLQFVKPRGDRCTCRYYFSNWKNYLEDVHFNRELKLRIDNKWAKLQSWISDS
eukprot:gene7428-10124_t